MNNKKIKFYDKNDDKFVTGLMVNNGISIPYTFLAQLDDDLAKLENIITVKGNIDVFYNKLHTDEEWLNKFKQAILGKINFISTVYGKASTEYTKRLNKYFNIVDYIPETDEYLSCSWKNFSYL